VTLTVVASIRHQNTDYDELLKAGVPCAVAREQVRAHRRHGQDLRRLHPGRAPSHQRPSPRPIGDELGEGAKDGEGHGAGHRRHQGGRRRGGPRRSHPRAACDATLRPQDPEKTPRRGRERHHARGRLCGCGNLGCWEQYASGRALVTEARERATGPSPQPPCCSRRSWASLTASSACRFITDATSGSGSNPTVYWPE
jgi:Uncharacterized conserved protein (DUF2293)/ROK family